MRQKTRAEKRLAGAILMAIGGLEFCVGIVIWLSKCPFPLQYLFWAIGILLIFWGRNWRNR